MTSPESLADWYGAKDHGNTNPPGAQRFQHAAPPVRQTFRQSDVHSKWLADSFFDGTDHLRPNSTCTVDAEWHAVAKIGWLTIAVESYERLACDPGYDNSTIEVTSKTGMCVARRTAAA